LYLTFFIFWTVPLPSLCTTVCAGTKWTVLFPVPPSIFLTCLDDPSCTGPSTLFLVESDHTFGLSDRFFFSDYTTPSSSPLNAGASQRDNIASFPHGPLGCSQSAMFRLHSVPWYWDAESRDAAEPARFFPSLSFLFLVWSSLPTPWVFPFSFFPKPS